MPIIKSAKKRVRQTKRKTIRRNKQKTEYRKLLKKGSSKSKGLMSKLYSRIDRAAKKRIISKKKSSRLKSKLA